MSNVLNLAVLGCGARGQGVADWVRRHPNQARITAIAEPDPARRAVIAAEHCVPATACFASWEELLNQPRLADVAVITLKDRLHCVASLKALDLGYHMLLEKPMAVTLQDCIEIDQARRRNNRMVSVCHSLRYHAVYRQVKRMIDEGAIGKVISIDQLEGVDPRHQAHSFVRGNWNKTSDSTFMLLAKSCHDIDVLIYLVGDECVRVSSFGSLSHFNRANKPMGAPPRCSDGCPHEAQCIYSAIKEYGLPQSWGQYIGMDQATQPQRDELIRTTDYGRCVYDSDNDVVDHQVVSFEFTGGATGTFTMTAFAPHGRQLRVHGTSGYITADIKGMKIEYETFGVASERRTINVPEEPGGHGGGDDNVIDCLMQAIRENNPSLVLTGTEESLRTHIVAFAAERARLEKRVVEVRELVTRPRLQIAPWVRADRRSRV